MARVVLGRRIWGAFALSAALLMLGLVLAAPALAAAGIFAACLVLAGARMPRHVRLEAEVRLSAPTAVERKHIGVKVHLKNTGRRPLLAEVRSDLPGPAVVDGGRDHGHEYLAGRESHEWAFGVQFHLFGLQRVGPVRVRLEDPFGFAAVEHTASKPVDVRVYPHRDSLRDPVLRAKQIRSILGRYDVPQPGHSFEFYGLRDYAVGDRPRDVNWKASARVGSLIVNQHQKESDAEVVLLVDVRAATLAGRATQSPFAQSCRAALAVGEAHLKARDAVRLIAYGGVIHEDRHTGATRRMQGLLDLAIGLEAVGNLTLGDVVRRVLPSLKPRSPVILFSPLVGDATVRAALTQLQSHEMKACVLVPRPDWGDAASPATVEWDARQLLELHAIRRLGVPIAHHDAGAPLLSSLEILEVRT